MKGQKCFRLILEFNEFILIFICFTSFESFKPSCKPTNTQKLRQFYIDNGVDYEIIDNAFGWGEKMMVLYNMKKIVNVIQIKPGDKIEQYDL